LSFNPDFKYLPNVLQELKNGDKLASFGSAFDKAFDIIKARPSF
jgi:hypothetical protein